MANKSQLFMDQMKPGTVSSEKSLQLMNNVRLIQLDFFCHFSKISNKSYFQNTLNNKDGILFTLNGLILLSVDWKALFILMLMVKNGCKLMLEHHMPLWKSLNKKEEFLKLYKQRETESHILKSIWINKHSKQKENTQLENSYNTFKFINQLPTLSKVLLTSINIYK